MSFSDFPFHPDLQAAIAASGYVNPTPIQVQAIPPVLAGRDVMGLAQTGTGKTAAFVLPILQRLQSGSSRKIRALVLAPTRELAEQINAYVVSMGKALGVGSVVLYGGVGKQPQVQKIRAGVEVVVACPGRLLDLIRDKAVDLSGLEILVLDEADHMFDRGFLPDLRRILTYLPKKRQTLVFSATMPAEIRRLTEDVLHDPARVQISPTMPAPSISHVFFSVVAEHKTALLKDILQRQEVATALVFTRTKHKAKSLALHLQKAGFRAASLQGNLSQNKRQQALDGFKTGTFNVLVATDIAARGIDVAGISHVVNFDLPDTVETYTHRTGRTGRAACTGEALTFVTGEDHKMAIAIERILGSRMTRQPVPTGLVADKPAAEALKREVGRPRTAGGDRALAQPRPARRRAVPPAGAKSRGGRSASFDFGVRSSGRR